MGKHVNSRTDTIIGTAFLALITIVVIVAIPPMIVTHSEKPQDSTRYTLVIGSIFV